MAQQVANSQRSATELINEMVEMLDNIGVDQNVALVLVALREGGFQSSRNLQEVCKLRQPEISIAVQQLLTNDMVAVEPLKSGGRGRPSHRYSLNGEFADIIQPFIDVAEVHINQLENDLARLESVSKDLATAAMSRK
jgi:predicted transcriptional regulator